MTYNTDGLECKCRGGPPILTQPCRDVSTVKTGAQSPASLVPVDTPTTALHCNTKSQFLADRAYATVLRLVVCRLYGMYCG